MKKNFILLIILLVMIITGITFYQCYLTDNPWEWSGVLPTPTPINCEFEVDITEHDTSIQVRYSTNSETLSTITYAVDGTAESTDVSTGEEAKLGHSMVIDGLSNSTLYNISISVWLPDNPEESCLKDGIQVRTTTGSEENPPNPVTDLYCMTPTAIVLLSWSEVSDVGDGMSHYIIYRSVDNNTWVELGQTELGTNSFTDDTAISGTYYYKVQPVDVNNNEQTEGNNVITIQVLADSTGDLSGFVRNYETHDPVSSATVQIFNSAGDSAASDATTDVNGSFTFTDLNTGDGYRIKVTCSGYNTTGIMGIRVFPDEEQNIGAVMLAPDTLSPDDGNVSAWVRDATNDSAVGMALVSLYDSDGTLIGSKYSGSSAGLFTLPEGTDEVSGGMYSIEISNKQDYFVMTCNNIFIDGPVNMGKIFLCPKFSESPEMRVILAWGEKPNDHDLHIATPASEHIYFGNKTGTDILMESDSSTGYGPEEAKITTLADGDYVFSVHNYSKAVSDTDYEWSNSIAEILIFTENTGLRWRIGFPVGEGDDPADTRWKAATLNVNGSDLSLTYHDNSFTNVTSDPGEIANILNFN